MDEGEFEREGTKDRYCSTALGLYSRAPEDWLVSDLKTQLTRGRDNIQLVWLRIENPPPVYSLLPLGEIRCHRAKF